MFYYVMYPLFFAKDLLVLLKQLYVSVLRSLQHQSNFQELIQKVRLQNEPMELEIFTKYPFRELINGHVHKRIILLRSHFQ